MKENFAQSLANVLLSEGGYSDNPHDSGGATNRGITQSTFDAECVKRGWPKSDVKFITSAQAATIYKNSYWDVEDCDNLPSGLDYAVFDWAVNSGDLKAETKLHIVMAAHPNVPTDLLIDFYMDERLVFLKQLSSWQYFATGWTNRVASVREKAHAMIKVNTASPSILSKILGYMGGLIHHANPVTKGATTMNNTLTSHLNNIVNGGLGAIVATIVGMFSAGTISVPTAAGSILATFIGYVLNHNTFLAKAAPTIATIAPTVETVTDDLLPQFKPVIDYFFTQVLTAIDQAKIPAQLTVIPK